MSLTMNYARHSNNFLNALLIDLIGRYAYNAPNLTNNEHGAYQAAIDGIWAELKHRYPYIQPAQEGTSS